MSSGSLATAGQMPTTETVDVASSFGRPRWLFMPAVAQILGRSQARALGLTEGPRRLGLFFLVCVLMGIIIPTEIAYDAEMFYSRRFLGIPPHFMLTAFTIAMAVVVDVRYYQRLVSRPFVALSLLILAALLVVGVAKYGVRSQLVRSDIYILRWFFVGFILTRLAIASGMLRQYLLFATVVILLTAFGIDTTNSQAGQIDTSLRRIVSSNLWPVINCGTIMIGLLLTVTWPLSLGFAAFGSVSFAVLAFVGSVRTSTRSAFFYQSLCFILVLLALSRDPRLRSRGSSFRRAATGLVMLGAVVVIYLVATGGLLGGYSQIGDRFRDTSFGVKDTGLVRLQEAIGMVTELTPDEWVLGKGLGGMFYSTMGAWFNVPHIAVFGFLQKGGIAVFLLVLVAVYIVPGLAFFKQLIQPRRSSPLPAPILIVGPVLVAWCGLTFISGGIDIGSFFGLGGLTALWIQLADDEKVFEAERRRFAVLQPNRHTSWQGTATVGSA